MKLIFEPLSDEPLARLYVYLTQPPFARVHELVRHARRHHHDLATSRLDDFVVRRESCGALLHHEDLLVGMPVQPRSAPLGCLHHDERDAGAVSESLELVGVLATRRVGHVDDALHTPPSALRSVSGMGASRNPPIIGTSQSARSRIALPGGMKCTVPGSTASWDFGRPARSPITPPSSNRKSSTACSRRMASESPTISRVGAAIPRMSSCDQAKGSMSSRFSLATSVGKSSGFGAVRRYSSSIGDPAKDSGVMDGVISSNSGCMPSLV